MVTPALTELLRESLVLWEIAARVTERPAEITVETDSVVVVIRHRATDPVAAWWVGPAAEKPCASCLGVLRALRDCLALRP